jgi:RHS repeat-associated protein
LQTVTDNTASPAYSATYLYLANSPLVSQIAFKSNTVTRMTTTKQYDFLNRLLSVSSAPSAGSALINSYACNNANQRIRSTLADGSYWLYEYDSLGQVRSGRKYWSDQTPVAGQQFEYAHDDIGNRTQTKAGGDQSGAGLRPANYSANNLNQYTSRDVPAAFDVMGLGFATNAVTVNSQAAYRKGEYFRAQVSVSNGSTSVWQSVTIAATNQSTISGNVFVPKTQEQFSYDLDGNLTNDGHWAYTWDAENRLVKLAPNTSIGPRNSLQFEYDWQGRRIHKQVWSNTGCNGTPTNDMKFVYDGWNLLAELNATNSAVIRSFLWGLDLSGSLQGAGGIGGLLEVTCKAAQTTNCFVAFDGNGNVAALADAASTNILAQYEYGPFGEVLRATGPMAKANPFRFSTKYQDDETDLLYYGYRYYSPSTGRWLSRDPIEEDGGFNLYGFVNSNPVNSTDSLGLVIETSCDAIDDYLKSLGISYERTGSYHYTFSGTDLGTGDADAKMIVTRMLFAGTVFKVSSTGGSATDNLKKHVEARLTIVRNALKANFIFGSNRIKWTGFHDDPQAFFDKLNNGSTHIACHPLCLIIFETGNKFAGTGMRYRTGPTPANLVWIPGDWGYIINKAFIPGVTDRIFAGENLFHTGRSAKGEMFWGIDDDGILPSRSESEWFDRVRHGWRVSGDPEWRDTVAYPLIGLERPTVMP